MNDSDGLQDLLQAEMRNQAMYNKYMLQIQHPEIRQVMMNMRDGKMQHVTQLQKEIQKRMARGKY